MQVEFLIIILLHKLNDSNNELVKVQNETDKNNEDYYNFKIKK